MTDEEYQFCGTIEGEQRDGDIPPVEPLVMLTFDDAINIAKGCMDYGGGYRSNDDSLAIYHHGIQTVINSLTYAAKLGLKDPQISVLHRIGKQTA